MGFGDVVGGLRAQVVDSWCPVGVVSECSAIIVSGCIDILPGAGRSFPCVHPPHSNPPRQGRFGLHDPPAGAQRAARRQGPPAHAAEPRPALRDRRGRVAAAVRAHRGSARRAAGAARRCARGHRGGGATHRRVAAGARRRGGARVGRGRRGGAPRFHGTGPTARRGRGAGGAVGDGAGGVDAAAGGAWRERRPARGGGRVDRRAPGASGQRARDAPLAAQRQRAGRVAGRGLRGHGGDAVVPGLRRPGQAPRRDRDAAVRARHGPVRPVGDGDAVRPDQHLLRGRGGQAAAGAARAFQGEAQRLSPAHARAGAGRLGVREPVPGVRRQRARAHHAAGDADGAWRPGRRPGGHGPGHRHGGADRLVARIRLPLSGRQPQAQARVRRPRPPKPSPPRRDTRCIWSAGSARTRAKSA